MPVVSWIASSRAVITPETSATGVRKFLHIKPLLFFPSSSIYSLKLLCMFSENLVSFGNRMPGSMCKSAYTRRTGKASPPFLPLPRSSLMVFCWQGEELVSELLIAAFLTSALLVPGQKTCL